MTTFVKPSIQWTDTIGAATLTCIGLTFRNWTPDWHDEGESEVAVGDGATYFFLYRTDHLASFEISQIANTELKLALRLKSHLRRGGTITINTQDSESRVYTSVVAPGTIPSLEMSDTTELEYVFKAVVKNTNEDPDVMLYTPEAHARASLIVLSPSPLTISVSGDPVDVTATITDALGNPVAGITLSAVSESPGAFTVSPSSGISDGSGAVVFTLTPVAGGSGNLTVSSPDAHASDVITVSSGVYGLSSPDPLLWLVRDSLTALANNDPISTWEDSGPGGWDASPESSFPTWVTGVFGGAVKFDHTTADAMRNSGFDGLSGATAFTMFYVCRDAGFGGLMACPGNFLYGYMTGGFFEFTDSGLAWRAKFTWTSTGTDNHIFELVYDGAGSGNSGKVKQYVDGAIQTGAFDGTIPTSLAVADGYTVGEATGVGHSDQWAVDVLIFPGALSAPDRATVRAAIAAKYGITAI